MRQQHARLLISMIVAGLLFSTPGLGVEKPGPAHSPTDVVVDQMRGDVHVTMAGSERTVAVGTAVELPSRILTGDDGHIDIRQGGTGVSIAPNSDVEIPEAAVDGRLIARMVQHSGNVFYNVETRPVERLRIETPYLVAVVKGTQFNVSVANGTTTISLFEGLLEIRSPDDGQVVELNAGQIAIRSAADPLIRLLPMDADQLDDPAGLDGRPVVDTGNAVGAGFAGGAGTARLGVGASSDMPLVGATVDIATVDIASSVIADKDHLDGPINATFAVGLDVGDLSANIDVGTGVDLGADVGLDAGIDLGGGSVDLGADVGLDTGVDLGGGGVDLGADVGLDAGVDLGGGSVDLGADVGLDTGVDLGGGDVDLGADAGLDAGVDLDGGDAGLDLGVDAGLDLGDDTGLDVDVDIDLDNGLDIDVDLGLGLGGGDDDSGGGLLGTLL